MEKYRVIGRPLILKGGIVGLTKEQAGSRGYCLEPKNKRKGLYEVTGEACFKIGEVLGIEDPDSLLKVGLVEPEDMEAAKARAKAEEEAKIKAEVDARLKAEADAKAEADGEKDGNGDGEKRGKNEKADDSKDPDDK